MIKAIKSATSIPVIANGEIRDEKTAGQVLEYTQCDGLMIGRAAVGDPYIFRRISNYIETGEMLPLRTFDERLDDFFECSYIKLIRLPYKGGTSPLSNYLTPPQPPHSPPQPAR